MTVPDFSSLRHSRPECPSDWMLDRLHAGEVAESEAGEARQHIAGCETCTARMAEREAGFSAIDGIDPRAMLARIRAGVDSRARTSLFDRIRAWGRGLLTPVALAAAAAVAVVIVTGGEQIEVDTRMKGGLALHVFRLAGDHAEEALSGDRFAPGDRLRFSVDLPGEGHVSVLGIEAGGALYTAWPLEPGVQTRFAAGTGIELPGAVALDDQPGRETLYLVHCPSTVGTPACTLDTSGKPRCPKSCAMTPFVLDKAR
ncbi:MAG: hypothetical protein JXB05_33380 [Myxococcaceae bacterium]|nr:hypothetical protein [Myxococcaceae bacterium]